MYSDPSERVTNESMNEDDQVEPLSLDFMISYTLCKMLSFIRVRKRNLVFLFLQLPFWLHTAITHV